MAKYNANNLRIKRRFFSYLKEAKRQSQDSVDLAAWALQRFEVYNKHRDFKSFHHEQAIGFKNHLAGQNSQATGKKLSKGTLNTTLAHLKRFFQWLATQPGYKSKFSVTDGDYFNLSEKDCRIATARRPRPNPTMEQVRHVLGQMPATSEIERRNRAVVAFALLTGARDSAIASMKLKHVDMAAGSVFQDARDVKTKFSKSFTTFFFPVGDEVRQILAEWVEHLRVERLYGDDDPLFPATRMELGPTGQFQTGGIEPKHWSNATPIRSIFRESFVAAGLPYFNPHSLRTTLAQLGLRTCESAEHFKAWSQNFGHEHVLTTLTSYGTVETQRQGEIIQALDKKKEAAATHSSTDEIAQAVVDKMRALGIR